MRPIFEFLNFREYLSHLIDAKGDESYGLKLRIAKALNVSSSLVSQVFKGQKTFSADQASDLCDFLGLSELEEDYFQLLVEFDRSGSQRYRLKLQRKLQALKRASLDVGKRVPRSKELSDEQKAIYYSSYLYTGVRNLTAVESIRTHEEIAKRLRVDLRVVKRVVDFLVLNKLCKVSDGKLTYGTAATHVDYTSPFVNKHHQNWRFQSIQQMESRRETDLFFTSPMSLSQSAFDEIRAVLPALVEKVMKISSPSSSEIVACLNIDWFEY